MAVLGLLGVWAIFVSMALRAWREGLVRLEGVAEPAEERMSKRLRI